ncbi:MAG: SRPBCC family protein [Mycobacteriales bacterium]
MMAATNREAEIIIDDKTPSIMIVRAFDAPAKAVFRAHTEPDLFVQWVGPDSLNSSRVDRWDCRTGGEWRYVSVRNDEEHWFRGCFHEVRPNELIVQTFTYEPWPDNVSLGRYVFQDLVDNRSRLTATSLVDSFEARDAFVASGMEVGVQEGFRKLDTLLAR